VLAEVSPGGGFGEDALLSGARRNATVAMLTDGALMRVNRAEFIRLCSGPLVQEVTFAEGERLVAKGGYWLDVRLPSEVSLMSIRGATNVPLFLLRRRMEQLPRGGTAVVYCDSGRRSAAAAFILASQGFDAVVLAGGLRGVPPEILTSDGLMQT
jgi:rhodanese-related sulfurtransferase